MELRVLTVHQEQMVQMELMGHRVLTEQTELAVFHLIGKVHGT